MLLPGGTTRPSGLPHLEGVHVQCRSPGCHQLPLLLLSCCQGVLHRCPSLIQAIASRLALLCWLSACGHHAMPWAPSQSAQKLGLTDGQTAASTTLERHTRYRCFRNSLPALDHENAAPGMAPFSHAAADL